jgi:hypothetical protein
LTARGASIGSGLGAAWPFECTKGWSDENAIRNGRYIVSPRGGNNAAIDIYDIALNTWEVGITFVGSAGMATAIGTYWAYSGNNLYCTHSAFNTMVKFDIPDRLAVGYGNPPILSTSPLNGNRAFMAEYRDEATRIKWFYHNPSNTASLLRKMEIE